MKANLVRLFVPIILILCLTGCVEEPSSTSRTTTTRETIRRSATTASTTPYVDKFQLYLDENDVTATNRDVQFDMANNVSTYFSLVGIANLSDYYNYGFDDSMKKDYFCLYVQPVVNGELGSIRESWYIYCHRDSFEAVFDQAIDEEYITVKMVCHIPRNKYKSNQGNMASLKYIVY